MRKSRLIDANVIIRYLVETPETINKKLSAIFNFFPKVAAGEIFIEIKELVLFQVWFVLKSYYKVPGPDICEALLQFLSFQGVRMKEKDVVINCLEYLKRNNTEIVDAYLIVFAQARGDDSIYSFDKGFEKAGLKLISFG